MAKDVIIACDFESRERTLAFLKKLGERKPFIKIGMELFYAEGPGFVNELKQRGYRIFLDLKLHDIPNTVRRTMSVLGKFDIDMCNVHAAGTTEMMEAAMEGISAANGKRPLVIAVTQLTSTTQEQLGSDLMIEADMESVVAHYAYNARVAGLDGVVCSPLEAERVHGICGEDFLTVTPGVRFAGDAKGDQKRVTTPAEAGRLGADYIVMGRSITGAEDPGRAYEKAREEFLKGGEGR